MSTLIRHPFHLVEESPWPLVASLGGGAMVSGLVYFFHKNSVLLFFSGLSLLIMVMYQWWRDVSYEGSALGFHSKLVELGLRWGMVLFIISEILFFMSFFWAFFHSSLAPTPELGGVWPPLGIEVFNPMKVPLLNTLVLLSSGMTVTWCHQFLVSGSHEGGLIPLAFTILLGVYFTGLQALEYYEASFSIADSVYGSTFFMATGFHGLHVIIGTLFLIVSFFRYSKGVLSLNHHFGFEAAAWYWHFVDVVWLFLYISVYWWGGK